MNPLNYASLEASKRLAEAGIVLETEAVWVSEEHPPFDGSTKCVVSWKLCNRQEFIRYNFGKISEGVIPAPSMAEVWRELPEASAYLHTNKETEVWLEDEEDIIPKSNSFADTNPTDSLIYLLIWVRKEASHEFREFQERDQ